MSVKRLALSFLKENKADYYLNDDGHTATYLCFSCGSKTIIDLDTTVWRCKQCKGQGDIETLSKLLAIRAPIRGLYNPRKERNEVMYRLRRLIKDLVGTEEGGELEKIYTKLERLLKEKDA